MLIVPGGPLRLLPFGALLTRETANSKNVEFKTLSYLINNYNLSYATSVALNVAMSKSSNNDYKFQFIGFAPVFASTKLKRTDKKEEKNLQSWAELSFSDYEVKTIASKLESSNSFWSILPWVNSVETKIFLRDEGTESNFKSNGSINARYIHLATHSFASDQAGGQTGIVFYQNGNKKNDDILYTNEIYNLQLHTELVVLSACETGVGTIIPGEGIMGLSRAFQYAGANNLIVSLWKVGDRSTANLMISFYSNLLKGYSIPRALSAAKREMISNQRYAQPRYWATFKLIGNGEQK